MPLPTEAQDRLGEIILKACSFFPKERYASPEQMRRALETSRLKKDIGRWTKDDADKTVYLWNADKAEKNSGEEETTVLITPETSEYVPKIPKQKNGLCPEPRPEYLLIIWGAVAFLAGKGNARQDESSVVSSSDVRQSADVQGADENEGYDDGKGEAEQAHRLLVRRKPKKRLVLYWSI